MPTALSRPRVRADMQLALCGRPAHNRDRRQHEIPIALAASQCPISRDFVPWRFLDAGPLSVRSVSLLPASKNLHKLGSRGFAPWVCFALAGGRERRLGEAQRRGRPPSSAASSTRCHCRSHTSEACSSVFIAGWIGCRLLRRGWRGEASFGQIDCAKLKRAKNLLGWQYVASQCFRHDTNIYTGLSCEPSLASCSLNFRTEQS